MTFDEIAVAAMQGILANTGRVDGKWSTPADVTAFSFAYAESMMAAIKERDAEIFDADLAAARESSIQKNAEWIDEHGVHKEKPAEGMHKHGKDKTFVTDPDLWDDK